MSYEPREQEGYGPGRIATYRTSVPDFRERPAPGGGLPPRRPLVRQRLAVGATLRARTLWDAMRGSWGMQLRA